MDGEGTVPGGRAFALGEIGLQQFAPYLMNRIMGRYNATLREALKAHGLTIAQMRTLAILAVTDGLTVSELSVYAVIEQSTLSRTLDAMEAQGLLRREPQASDNRVRRVSLNEAGRALFEEVWPVMRAAFGTMFKGIDDGEYAAFVAVLQKILANIRRHDF
ncbi:MarR family winged helix-turn-helix transcriptional regulator [Mangrovibrevibacter kandeliae]|uniref:MarR family winged helix-turn-helix transcriptional regulator n=1 Tax=Mangrovibrevibacter kandeliae TaxID=2968473 RepID=UPI002118B89B|nr:MULTISPECIES: MarR family transcriptional regulator [unclassified Aurantimonas]MCQ8782090.1 MarR family transcriptional regulator [Aurantimonas sp. CSK15Z-1]MCW4115250.1 MarR family transcriptional regulator [Aurantimonas sp. MSK8Z-1]